MVTARPIGVILNKTSVIKNVGSHLYLNKWFWFDSILNNSNKHSHKQTIPLGKFQTINANLYFPAQNTDVASPVPAKPVGIMAGGRGFASLRPEA